MAIFIFHEFLILKSYVHLIDFADKKYYDNYKWIV